MRQLHWGPKPNSGMFSCKPKYKDTYLDAFLQIHADGVNKVQPRAKWFTH